MDSTDAIPVYRETSRDVPASTGPGQVPGIGVLEIEAIGLKMPVSYGATESSLKVSVGWIPQTAD